MKIETVHPDTLQLDPENARRHPAANIEAIKASLIRFGQVAPIVVRKGVVVGGNGTLTALRALNRDEVKIVQYEGTIEEAKALAIALNRSAELAEWDEDTLSRTVSELAEDFDAAIMGFTEAELKALLKDLVPHEVVIQAGLDEDEGELPDNRRRKDSTGTPQYALLFDDEDQQQRFFEFLAHLESLYPEAKSAAARIDALARDAFGGGT